MKLKVFMLISRIFFFLKLYERKFFRQMVENLPKFEK